MRNATRLTEALIARGYLQTVRQVFFYMRSAELSFGLHPNGLVVS